MVTAQSERSLSPACQIVSFRSRSAFVVPWRVDHNGPKRAGDWLDREALVLVLLLPKLSTGTVDLTGPVHISGEGPKRSGSLSATVTTAAIFSTVRPETPVESADLVDRPAAITWRNFRRVLAEGSPPRVLFPSPAP
jgi:hypothetical protein